MRFCDFLKKLYDHSPCSNQGQFVLEAFSALCGEENPASVNQESTSGYVEFRYSDCLPVGLCGEDGTFRKRLFGGNKKYQGLTDPIKAHIRANKNKNTFIAYCHSFVSEHELSRLCADFEVPDTTGRAIFFEALFDQFMEYSKSQDDDVAVVIQGAIMGMSEKQVGTTEAKNTIVLSLYPCDDYSVAGDNPVRHPDVDLYEKFEHTWVIHNSGQVVWEGRHLEITNQQEISIKAAPQQIEIPTLYPGEEARIAVTIDARHFERESVAIWQIKNHEGQLCFPNKNGLQLAVRVVYNFTETI